MCATLCQLATVDSQNKAVSSRILIQNISSTLSRSIIVQKFRHFERLKPENILCASGSNNVETNRGL